MGLTHFLRRLRTAFGEFYFGERYFDRITARGRGGSNGDDVVLIKWRQQLRAGDLTSVVIDADSLQPSGAPDNPTVAVSTIPRSPAVSTVISSVPCPVVIVPADRYHLNSGFGDVIHATGFDLEPQRHTGIDLRWTVDLIDPTG